MKFLSPFQYGYYGFGVTDGHVANYLVEDFTAPFTPDQDALIVLSAEVDSQWQVSQGTPKVSAVNIEVLDSPPSSGTWTVIGRIKDNEVRTLNTHNKDVIVTRWIAGSEPLDPGYISVDLGIQQGASADIVIAIPGLTSTLELNGGDAVSGTLELTGTTLYGNAYTSALAYITGNTTPQDALNLSGGGYFVGNGGGTAWGGGKEVLLGP
ncbi:MAG: hypothetical protein LBS59_08275 [Puniceicoccales bacterium]|jgi:hypothetical protein|nr:hypothetical protein [Puniceicoccales bacterium]